MEKMEESYQAQLGGLLRDIGVCANRLSRDAHLLRRANGETDVVLDLFDVYDQLIDLTQQLRCITDRELMQQYTESRLTWLNTMKQTMDMLLDEEER